MVILTALSKVLPIFLLILLGVVLRRIRLLSVGTVEDLRKLVVNVTLPAALFLAFAQVSIELQYLFIVILMFLACWLVLMLGRFLGSPLQISSPILPSLLTGFEAGMMGYAIFAAVYGQENIYKFGIVDLGQVLFVFFILVPGLVRLSAGAQPFRATIISFFKTPVILAIVGGLLFKQLGLTELFSSQPLTNSILETLRLVGGMTTPLVAIVIGFGLQFKAGSLGYPLRTVAVRLLVWIPFGLAMGYLIMGNWLGLDPVFQAAALTMVILPPPFVIPLFMSNSDGDDTDYVLNTLTLATLVTLVAYTIVPVLFPPG
ncbi:MAG: hypothetical protein J5I90_21235 [Caldilineales bacterium]|nr:hypothetical protein [Caldilineales bacterium]